MKKFILIWIGVFTISGLDAQEKTVTGKITTFNEIAVIKAQILVKSSNRKFYSDTLGLFYVQCADKDKLTVSAEGFITSRIRIKMITKYALINLTLKPGEEATEIASGYGHVRDKDKLYAMSSKETGEMNYSSYRDIYEILIGAFPGVQIINGEVIIRGSASMESDATALLIVDGREVSRDSFASILPSDIARISILKDASASVYGVQGGNGVVIVETKRGGGNFKK